MLTTLVIEINDDGVVRKSIFRDCWGLSGATGREGRAGCEKGVRWKADF